MSLFSAAFILFSLSIGSNALAQFEDAFFDATTGLHWSKVIKVDVSNAYANSGSSCKWGVCGKVISKETSPAAKLCEDIGGRLPTGGELADLMLPLMERTPSRHILLSDAGRKKLESIFGTSEFQLWTSSFYRSVTQADRYSYSALFDGTVKANGYNLTTKLRSSLLHSQVCVRGGR